MALMAPAGPTREPYSPSGPQRDPQQFATITARSHHPGTPGAPSAPLVAVLGDVRLMCECVALILCADSIPAVLIDRNDSECLALRPEGVILILRVETSLDAALDFVERSWPGLSQLLLMTCSSPPARLRSRSVPVTRIEVQCPVDNLVSTVAAALEGRPGDWPPRDRQHYVAKRPQAWLTAREREVLEILASGSSIVAAATQLEVAPNTVRSHLASVRSKVGVSTTLEAVCLHRNTRLSRA